MTTDPYPRTTDPMTTDPMTMDAMTTDLMTMDPMTTDPMTTDPMTMDPMTTDPMTMDRDPTTIDSNLSKILNWRTFLAHSDLVFLSFGFLGSL